MRRNVIGGSVVKAFLLCVTVICAVLSLTACSLLFGGNNSDSTGNQRQQTSGQTKSYEITLHVEGFRIEDFIDKDTLIIKKPTAVPEKTGYEFVRWCSDEACTKELEYGTKISSDLSVYADWKVKVLTVTLVDEVDHSESELSVTYNEKAVLPDKTAAGYEFKGWFADKAMKTPFDTATKITEDLTLYAGWTAIEYDIHYTTYGGELSENYAETYNRFSAKTLPTCVKEGYDFVGWYDNDQLRGNVYTEIPAGQYGEKSFFAKYVCTQAEARSKRNSVTVTDDAVSFSVKYVQATVDLNDYLLFSDNATVKILREKEPDVWEEILTLLIDENDTENEIDYVFALDVTSEKGTTTKRYQLNIKQYTARNVTVSYYSNGFLIERDEDREAGGYARTPDDPEPLDGYVFDRWVIGSVDGDEFDFDTVLSEDIDLYAKYDTIDYSVVYYLGYGSNNDDNPATYTVEDAVALEDAVSTSEEYTFEGWYSDDTYATKVTSIEIGTTGELSLYARYTLKNGLVKDFADRDEIALSELKDYFLYAFYYRLTSLEIIVTGGEEGESIVSHINEAKDYAGIVDGSNGISISYQHRPADASGEWDMTDDCKIEITYQAPPSRASQASEYPQVDHIGLRFSETGRGEEYNDFAIEHVADALPVTDTEQLVFAVEHGYRPLPTVGSAAEEVYEKAKVVLRTYLDDGMTDFEKALAIYDYIAYMTAYDHDVFDRVIAGTLSSADAASYNCFYLEGVFNDNIAVCDGYSKAFMLLCRMEGLRVYQVEGSAVEGGTGHAWNKIRLAVGEGERDWYVVDCTSADTLTRFSENDAKEVLTHAYFLYSDRLMETRYEVNANDETAAFEATQGGDYYSKVTFEYDEQTYSQKIASDAQMVAFLKYLIASTPDNKQVSLDLSLDEEYDPFTYNGEDKINGIRQEILNSVGVVINGYNVNWMSSETFNSYTFLCKKK